MKNSTKYEGTLWLARILIGAFTLVTFTLCAVLGYAAYGAVWYAQVGYSVVVVLWIFACVTFYLPVIKETLDELEGRYEDS